MKNNKYFFIFLLALYSLGIFSQKNASDVIKLEGRVLSEKGRPVQGVKIIIDGVEEKSVTDKDGFYKAQATDLSEISFKKDGYIDVSFLYSDLYNRDFFVVLEEDVNISLPFRKVNLSKNVGNVVIIDAQKEYEKDSRKEVISVIEDKVPGMFSNLDVFGLGNACVVIDGIPSTLNELELKDIDKIYILKDASSRILYSSESDIPVIYATTLSGKSGKHEFRLNAEQGIDKAISYPKFLNAADYMETYNLAYKNDGRGDYFYDNTQIKNTREGVDPVLYPDNDYYGSEYMRIVRPYTDLFGSVSGGNEKVKYLLRFNWNRLTDFCKINSTIDNRLSLRGKVDFDVTSWMKMNTQILASYGISSGPNIDNTSYYASANTLLPNAYPELIPIDRINNLETLPEYSLIDDKYLLGGTSIYYNTMYGALLRSGEKQDLERYVQQKVGMDLDLGRILNGLTLHGGVSFDFYNFFTQKIENSYAIYEIVGSPDSENKVSVSPIGQDKVTTKQTVDEKLMDGNRSIKWFYNLNYDKEFKKHNISAVFVGMGRFFDKVNDSQQMNKLGVGLQATYSYDKRFIVDLGGLWQSSMKVKTSDRFGFSKSLGAAWIVSNENFLKSNKLIDYLKIRFNYGQIKSDNFALGLYNGYFLNENIYKINGKYIYNQGQSSSDKLLISGVDNDITWEMRKEFSIGVDMSILNNKLSYSLNYVKNIYDNQLVNMDLLAPATIGSFSRFANYNSTDYNIFDFTVRYSDTFGKIQLDLGLNYMYTSGKFNKVAEPEYLDKDMKHLNKVGTDPNSIWGLKSMGLYMPEDFNNDGTLISGLPTPVFGEVKSGDIKYEDYNKDGVVDDNDAVIIGRNNNNNFMSMNFSLTYKNWSFFMLPVLEWGGSGITNSKYYWFRGENAKYSEVVKNSFNELAPDPNAEYPRITLGNGNNNYRSSTYWLYSKTKFNLSSVQLSYTWNKLLKNKIDNLRLYLRCYNIMTLAKDKDIIELNYGMAPQTRSVVLGFDVKF